MTDDIVTRLRGYLAIVDHAFVWNELSEAADEIERLRAERDRWRKIADDLHDQVVKTFCWHCGHEWTRHIRVDELVETYRQAVVDAQEVRGAW